MSVAFRISVGANLVLLGLVVALLWRDPHPTVPSPAAASLTPLRTETSSSDAATAALRPKSAAPRLTPATMLQLEEAGISREVLVSALLEHFNRRWDQRLAQLEKSYTPRQVPEREYIELARLREAEQVQELKQALGEEGFLAWDKERTLRALNSAGVPLTAAEVEQAYRLQKEFDEKHKELQMAMEDGVADRADAATLQAQAQDALERELEKLFGRQRLDAMRGITDAVAQVHWRYGELNPTPAQTDAVLRAEGDYRAREAALAAQLKDNPADAASVAAELKALNDAREENLRRILGPEAYDRLQRQNDPTYKTLQHYAGAWDLNPGEIQSVYEALRVFQDEAQRTRSAAAMSEAAGQQVNWREVSSAIEQAQQQTETSLSSLIGGERLRRLKQNGLLTTR